MKIYYYPDAKEESGVVILGKRHFVLALVDVDDGKEMPIHFINAKVAADAVEQLRLNNETGAGATDDTVSWYISD